MPKFVQVPEMRFCGGKVFLESQGNDSLDESTVRRFVDYMEYHCKRPYDVKDYEFYHQKAIQFLGTGGVAQ